MLNNFIGNYYSLATEWFDFIDINEYQDKPINYLEIGTFYGGNILSVSKTYGKHSDSKLYCIDIWNQYKNQDYDVYKSFIQNIQNAGIDDKIIIYREDTNMQIPKLTDLFFDIICVDGNYEPEYILENAILSFRKLKFSGVLVLYNSVCKNGKLKEHIQRGIMAAYYGKIKCICANERLIIYLKKSV